MVSEDRHRTFTADMIEAGTKRLCNVAKTSMQRHDVDTTLFRRCVPAGIDDTFPKPCTAATHLHVERSG